MAENNSKKLPYPDGTPVETHGQGFYRLVCGYKPENCKPKKTNGLEWSTYY
jgi:hypothetical protein